MQVHSLGFGNSDVFRRPFGVGAASCDRLVQPVMYGGDVIRKRSQSATHSNSEIEEWCSISGKERKFDV